MTQNRGENDRNFMPSGRLVDPRGHPISSTACFVGDALAMPDRFLRAVIEYRSANGEGPRVHPKIARRIRVETPGLIRTLAGCEACGLIFEISEKQQHRRLCDDCQRESRVKTPPLLRRGSLRRLAYDTPEPMIACLWCSRGMRATRSHKQTCSAACRAHLKRYLDRGGVVEFSDPATDERRVLGQDTPARVAAATYRGIELRPDL